MQSAEDGIVARFYFDFFTIEFLKRYQIFLYSDIVSLPSYKKLTFQEQCVLI